MMEVIVKPRGHGKTTKAIKLANETGSHLVVMNQREANWVKNDAKLKVLTYADILTRHLAGVENANIIIDNADALLQRVCHDANIIGVTITGKCQNRPLSGWMSIKSAPRDGTLILAFIPSTEYDNYQDTVFYHEDENEVGWYNGRNFETPTHWMPLPKPPEK